MNKTITDEIFEKNTLDTILNNTLIEERNRYISSIHLKLDEKSKTGIRTINNYTVIGYCTLDIDEQPVQREVTARPGPLLNNITVFKPEILKEQIKNMIQEAQTKPIRILYSTFEPDLDTHRPSYNEIIENVIPKMKENKYFFRQNLVFEDFKLTDLITTYMNTRLLDK